MCHPTINSNFQQAALDKFLNTSVVNITFNSSVLDELNKISLAVQIKLPDMEFSKRKYEVEDFESCRDLNEERSFKAWITVRAAKMSKAAHPSFMFKNLET